MRHALILAALAACDSGELNREDLDKALDWGEGFETVGTTGTGGTDDPGRTTDTVDDKLFNISSPLENYPIFLQTWDPETQQVNEGEACQVDLEGLQAGDHVLQYCIMDVNELDLKLLGYPLDVNIPAGTCDWYEAQWYQYEDWPTDYGAGQLNIVINADGTVVDDSNTFLGAPVCFAFDHRPYGPNCCLGSWTMTVDNRLTGEIYDLQGQWGGIAGDCYDGTSYVMANYGFDDDNFPLNENVFLDKSAFTESYQVVGDPAEYSTNVGLANYFDPADHAGEAPAGLNKIDLNGNGLEDPGDRAMKSWKWNSFYCKDDADDIYAEIRLVVREWNTEEEFNKRSGGDPDVGGFEPGPANDPDARDGWDDWDDWETLAPSNVVWTYDND
jgi:hypothetical protein